MILRNVQIVGQEGATDIRVKEGIISAVTMSGQHFDDEIPEGIIDLDNALAFPGLINSHDHLDFNLYPLLGNCIYNNYTEWGKDIHENDQETIAGVLRIPQGLRVQWGMYKNLLNGVTTVVNHGKKLVIKDEIISVFQDCHILHSIAFEKRWKFKLNRPLKRQQPVVMHIGEGTDAQAREEINTLIRWNLFKRNIIGIHAVAMKEEEADRFKAIVWCPSSNYFLLSATAPIDQLKKKTNILFGTDATLTAGWNIWEHLRMARSSNMMNDSELLDAVTQTAAIVWGLDTGSVSENYKADLVVAENNGAINKMDAFYALNPEHILLVIKAGRIILYDEKLHSSLSKSQLIDGNFSKVEMSGKRKWVVGNLPALALAIQKHHAGIQFPFQ